MNNRLTKQEKESLDNKIVFSSVALILYALLLAFVQRMSASPVTVNGALAFIEILRWVALAGAMCCAAWSAYKEKKGFFIYCAACLFIFLSTTVLKFCTQRSSEIPYYINYAALAVMFVLVQAYSFIKSRGLFDNKTVKAAFVAICILAIIGFAVISIMNVNRVFF